MPSHLDENIHTNKPPKPHFIQKHPWVRSKIIEVWGAVFAVLYGSTKKLWVTGVRYMKNGAKRWPIRDVSVIDESWLQAQIHKLKEAGRGVIILNHHCSKFPDYLPAFWYLGDDILRQTLFFTGPYNLEMNRKQFPWYQFEPAVEGGRNEMHGLLEVLKMKLKAIHQEWGYIFLIPAWPWEDYGNNKPFQALFGQILRWLSHESAPEGSAPEIPIMAFHIEHSEPISYGKILLKRFGLFRYNTTLEWKLTRLSEWPDRGWVKQRAFYNQLFKKSP